MESALLIHGREIIFWKKICEFEFRCLDPSVTRDKMRWFKLTAVLLSVTRTWADRSWYGPHLGQQFVVFLDSESDTKSIAELVLLENLDNLFCDSFARQLSIKGSRFPMCPGNGLIFSF